MPQTSQTLHEGAVKDKYSVWRKLGASFLLLSAVGMAAGVAVYLKSGHLPRVSAATSASPEYFRLNQPAGWEFARLLCENAGGSLAKILNYDDQKRADAACRGACWIGLTRDVTGEFHWLDGTKLSATGPSYLWTKNYPANIRDLIDVYISRSTWWNTNPFGRKFPLCQKPAMIAPKPQPGSGPKQFFTIFNRWDTWESSIENCKEYGGELAIIKNDAEEAAARAACPTSCWVAGRYDTGRTWKWTDGTAIDRRWAPGYPRPPQGKMPVNVWIQKGNSALGGFGTVGNVQPKVPLCMRGEGIGPQPTSQPTVKPPPRQGFITPVSEYKWVTPINGKCDTTCSAQGMKAVSSGVNGGAGDQTYYVCGGATSIGFTDVDSCQANGADTFKCLCEPSSSSSLWVRNRGYISTCTGLCKQYALKSIPGQSASLSVCSSCVHMHVGCVIGSNAPKQSRYCNVLGEEDPSKEMACLCGA